MMWAFLTSNPTNKGGMYYQGLYGSTKKTMLMKKTVNRISSLALLACFSLASASEMQTLMPASHSSVKHAVSEQTQLWTNADKIDDGGVYFIRNANNSNFVWDMPNNNYSDGTAPILYSSTGWGNQRFIVHEQTKYGGKMYYTITPLYSPKSTLKLGSNNENDTLKLGKDNNTSL